MLTKWKRTLVACALVTAMVLGSTGTAFGQYYAGEEDFVFTMTSSTTTAAVVGGIVLTVVLVVAASSADMEDYMRDNAVAIQHDIYMGAGETARDLASVFHVPDEQIDAFAALLFANRAELAPLAEPGMVTSESAVHFMRIVVENMLDDENLAASARQLIS